MATNTIHSEPRGTPARNLGAHQAAHPRTFTPGRAVIITAWVVAVLMMLMAIAHVARGQVSKGPTLHKAPTVAHATKKVYASHGGSRVADLEPAHIQATYQR